MDERGGESGLRQISDDDLCYTPYEFIFDFIPILIIVMAFNYVAGLFGRKPKQSPDWIDEREEYSMKPQEYIKDERELRVICGYCGGMYDYKRNSCSHCGGDRVSGKPVWINGEGEIIET